VHRDKITVSDVMGHASVQPFRHATSLGKPTRNPSYLASSVFTRTLVDRLTPQLMEPSFADIERASGRSKPAEIAAVSGQHPEVRKGRG
jgi:hypothetical protein